MELGEKVPAWGISRWGSNKSLRFVPFDEEWFSLQGDKRRLLYKGRRRSHRFTILGDSAFEYDCILEREPDSNVVSLLMEGAESFDFFRQPDFVSDPFLKGSYAVYKKETLFGEGTGKLCHIHRPEIIDARGRRCWGDLAIAGNMLCITIPEQWLSNASYPVIVDPIIGTTTIGSQITGPDPNNRRYDRPWLDNEFLVNKYRVAQNGNGLCTAFVYCYHTATDDFAWPILYTDVNNKPHKKKSINERGIRVSGTSPAWRSNTFNLNGGIAAGENVWFGLYASWFTTRFDYGTDCYKGWFDWDIYEDYDGEPTPYIDIDNLWTSYSTIRWSMYFTYTAVTGQNYLRTLTQGVNLSDSQALKAKYSRATTEKVKVNSSLSRFEFLCRKCAETVRNTMTISQLPLFISTVKENIKITLGKWETRFVSRKCADTVTSNTYIKRTLNIFRNIQDELSGLDGQSFSVLFIRSVKNSAIAETKNRQSRSFIRGLFSAAGSVTETGRTAGYYRYQGDMVQAESKMFRGLLLFVRIVSQVFVRDYLLDRFLKARRELVLKSYVCREITLDSKI